MWKDDGDEGGKNMYEEEFLLANLQMLGKGSSKVSYTKITNLDAGRKVVATVPNMKTNALNVIVYNFVDMLSHARTDMKVIKELDVIKGELKRDIIDYNELVELQPDDILNLQDKINTKLEEIEDSISDVIKIGDDVEAERRAVFNSDMTPDQIRKYGIKNRLYSSSL